VDDRLVAVILFPLGARLSTWIGLAMFIAFAGVYRDRRFLIAALVWMTGFEAFYDMSSLVANPSHWRLNVFFLVCSLFTVLWFRNAVPKPDLRLMALVAVVWVVWFATGFHVNSHGMAGFEPSAEALNEGAKTLWALAYLIPLYRILGRTTPATTATDPQPA
jgi:hypothetical protein